jgi:hypothetical protein
LRQRLVNVSGEVDRVHSWKLSTVDIQLLVDALSLPPLPYPLETPSPGEELDERRRLVEPVRADLVARGLSANGTLGDALVLLAVGELVIDGRLIAGPEVDLVSTVWGDRAALAVRNGDTVRVDLVDDSAVTDLIVDLLPAMPQLPAISVLPHEAVATALAAARFGVAARTPATDEFRDRRGWTWYASEAGGFLLAHDSNDSPTWTTLVPAAPAGVGQCLSDALHDLRYRGVRGVAGE